MNQTAIVSDAVAPARVCSLRLADARLHYEVRGSGPLLLLVGCPMDATAFAPLADQLAADHTVLTTDPRGINRSTVDQPDQDVTPEMLAADLSRLIAAMDAGPAAVFGSSGGAVSALALAIHHPDQVHTVIAHEPPLDELLEDRVQLRESTEQIVALYLSGDVAGAWTKFLGDANIVMAEDETGPQLWGEPDPQAIADERFFFEHTMRPTSHWQPDLAALRGSPTRIVVGIGEASAGELCDRTSNALAERLELRPNLFPGGHIAFVEDPDGFATALQLVLS